jgi:CRP/FNR family transcriptional regulator, nitrogen oxide reductase regulator
MVGMTIAAAILRQLPIFADVSERERDVMAQSARQVSLAPRAYLFRQGDAGDSVYIVVSGRLRLLQHTLAGHDVALDIYGPNELIMPQAMPGPGIHNASCEAMNAAVVLVMPAETLLSVMAVSPQLMRRVFGSVLTQLRDAQDHARELSAETAEQRIARTMFRLAAKSGVSEADHIRIDLPVTRQGIADLSGTTLHTASRVLSLWHRAGWVYAGREAVTLLAPRVIQAIAEGRDPSLR